MRVYGDVYCQTLNSTDSGDHVFLFISRVRANFEQKRAGTRAEKANKSWAGTETYDKTGAKTCKNEAKM